MGTTVNDCRLVDLPRIDSPAGRITAVHNAVEIPFAVKRVYYLYDVPGGEFRGGHAHREMHQLFVAASGSFSISLFDGKNEIFRLLSRPYVGLYVPPGLWRELTDFSSGAVCLVLASTNFSESDYIRNRGEFIDYKQV